MRRTSPVCSTALPKAAPLRKPQKARGVISLCEKPSAQPVCHSKVVTVVILQSACDRTRVAVFNSTCCTRKANGRGKPSVGRLVEALTPRLAPRAWLSRLCLKKCWRHTEGACWRHTAKPMRSHGVAEGYACAPHFACVLHGIAVRQRASPIFIILRRCC